MTETELTDLLVRPVVLAVSAALCGALAGIAAIYAMGKTLPPTDDAYGQTVMQSLGDPFVFGPWVFITFSSAFVGFLVSLWVLWDVRLVKAIPLVFAVTIGTAAFGGAVNIFLAVPFTLSVSVVTMILCRAHEPWRIS
jgi:hypothetical protein